jgi:hypothetical protein
MKQCEGSLTKMFFCEGNKIILPILLLEIKTIFGPITTSNDTKNSLKSSIGIILKKFI